MFVFYREIPGALGYGDPRRLKQYLEDHGVTCWIDVERVGMVRYSRAFTKQPLKKKNKDLNDN